MTRRLGIGDLMEGGLALLRERWMVVILFVGVNGALFYGGLWAEDRYEWGPVPVTLFGLSTDLLASAALLLALGDQLRQLLSDPVELFIRCAFGAAAWFIVIICAAGGLMLLIVPGLYLQARWMIATPLILLDGCGILEGLRRSWSLTDKSTWPLVIVIVTILIPQLLFGYGESAVTEPGATLVTIVAMSLITAFEIAVAVFAYRALSGSGDDFAETFA